MAIELQQGQSISISKLSPGLSKILCGLGWDLGKHSSGGLFSNEEIPNCDLDASVICLDSNGTIDDPDQIIYFDNLQHKCGGLTHLGDNKTGAGIGDDEQILVDLDLIPPEIHKLVFTVSIYECQIRGQDFSQIDNAYVRLVDRQSEQELARYELSGQAGVTGLIMAEIYRQDGEWFIRALGKGLQVSGLEEIVKGYAA